LPHGTTDAAASTAESAEAAASGSPHPVFTVVTLLRNQAPLLESVWRSLEAQTCADFEWLIVDDGSSDGADAVARRFAEESRFAVRYVRQPYRGRHVAWNRAMHLARGELCVCLEPGDSCAPPALERFLAHWNAIPEEARPLFSGVTVLSLDAGGNPVSPPFPPEASISSPFVPAAAGPPAPHWTALRAEVAKRFLFPVIPNERHLDERIVWNRVAGAFRTFCVNEALRTLAPEPGPDLGRLAVENPLGARLLHMETLELPFGVRTQWRCAVEYVRFSRHAGKHLRSVILDPPRTLLVLCALPAGWYKWLRDRWSMPRPARSAEGVFRDIRSDLRARSSLTDSSPGRGAPEWGIAPPRP
jgi:glycosyltransferase involved in cell wall biosynthesis